MLSHGRRSPLLLLRSMKSHQTSLLLSRSNTRDPSSCLPLFFHLSFCLSLLVESFILLCCNLTGLCCLTHCDLSASSSVFLLWDSSMMNSLFLSSFPFCFLRFCYSSSVALMVVGVKNKVFAIFQNIICNYEYSSHSNW